MVLFLLVSAPPISEPILVVGLGPVHWGNDLNFDPEVYGKRCTRAAQPRHKRWHRINCDATTTATKIDTTGKHLSSTLPSCSKPLAHVAVPVEISLEPLIHVCVMSGTIPSACQNCRCALNRDRETGEERAACKEEPSHCPITFASIKRNAANISAHTLSSANLPPVGC